MLFVLDIFVECLRELIGAGSALKAATDAGKTLDGIVYVHAGQKSGNALGIAGTSAVIFRRDQFVTLHLEFDVRGAGALILVHISLCHIVSLSLR